MTFWAFFWGALLLAALVGFAGLTLVVAIGGWKEIRTLFEAIDAQHRDKEP